LVYRRKRRTLSSNSQSTSAIGPSGTIVDDLNSAAVGGRSEDNDDTVTGNRLIIVDGITIEHIGMFTTLPRNTLQYS
jgi:hypothetical protein